MDNKRLKIVVRMAELTAKSISGSITELENEELEQMLAESSHNRELFEEMQSEDYREQLLQEMKPHDTAAAWKNASGQMELYRQKRIKIRQRFIAAASIALLILGGLTYFILSRQTSQTMPLSVHQLDHDVAPGGTKAKLVLANGQTVILGNNINSSFVQKTVVVNQNMGKLFYQSGNKSVDGLMYNTLITPRGGQYQVTLSDGTKVWLNAASSLRYPIQFNGKERKVELSGEAYFEVAKNEKMPFKVESKGSEIQVLGTRFNVMAYKKEPEQEITLLQGSVKVVTGQQFKLLQPGEQAMIKAESENIEVAAANTDQAIAWKNGFFQFDNATIPMIMRQMARWYNVDVVYEGNVPVGHFRGKASRSNTLSQALKILEYSGIHFEIQGRKIIVKQ